MMFKYFEFGMPTPTGQKGKQGRREEGSVWEDGGSAQRCLMLDCRSVAVFSSLHREDGANPRTRAGHGH